MSNHNGSGEIRLELADVNMINHIPNSKYKNIMCRFTEVKDKFDRDVMLRFEILT